MSRVANSVPGLLLTLALVGCGAGCGAGADVPERPPDVFLVSIDTLRADHLSSYGHSRDTAPFLDRLAAEGLHIEDAVVVTHGTTPSHASILTSTPQEVHGVGLWGRTDDRVPSSLPNLPERFSEAGYRTVAVTGGGNVGKKFGFARGFDVYDDTARSASQGRDLLLDHLADVPPDVPVFVFFHTYEVHSPYAPPPEIAGRFGYRDSDFPTTSRNLVDHANRAGELAPQDLEHLRARYDEGIVHADRVLESLFTSVREFGRLDPALVAVTSDHGEEFGEHGGLVHRDLLYDELLRVPLIFWGSGLPGEVEAPQSASSLDIAPTLASCAGLEVPADWHGRDLLCSRAEPSSAARALISQYGSRRYSVRTERWKLIVTRTESDPIYELYDLESDPRERRNVAAEHPGVVGNLKRELKVWRSGLTTVREDDGGPVELDAEERQRLEALGYL